MRFNFRLIQFSLGIVAIAAVSCSGGNDENGNDTPGGDSLEVNTGLRIKGQSFMVPSPVQIATLIKNSGALYNKGMLNATANLSVYSDAMKRALNLGVYGADLGYITMYENTGDAMEYYRTVVLLGEQLKITGSFDQSLMQRFNDNVGRKDSILVLVGEAYRRSDQFLRESEQDNTAALILAGGWVESMWFALNVYKEKPEDAISVRIGEQKSTAEGILNLLRETNKPEYKELIKYFDELNQEFQKVEIKYTFAEPTNDEAHKVTSINGKTEVKISPSLLTSLLYKVTELRNYITK
ncbi:MAG TPA: hypothetical protein VI731_04030 [Bacteroidia bacterium]|nr:hypothetical protein [Bacteroidia bacterium]